MQRKNFGGNQVLNPSSAYTPADEQEVLQILDKHRGQRIRAVGSLHSWSDAILGDDVLLDLRRLNDVQLQPDGDQFVATVGAGCQIKRLLKELARDGATGQSPPALTVRDAIACRTMSRRCGWLAMTIPLVKRLSRRLALENSCGPLAVHWVHLESSCP